MSILFSSDYHIGVNRYSHTTVASRKMLKDVVFHAAVAAAMTKPVDYRVCLGDMFDTFSNKEEDILLGHQIARYLNLCLAGNHDMSNDANKLGSLGLIADADCSDDFEVSRVGVAQSNFRLTYTNEATLFSVPHHASQGLFEQGLEEAMATVSKTVDRPAILLLHCNYNMPAAIMNETSLNLTEADAEILLEVFDYILLGHDHTPAEYFGGRLIVVGNTFPTSFGDISDKRVITFDGKRMQSHKIWDASTGYLEATTDRVFNLPETVYPESVKFLKITGSILPEQVNALSKSIKQIWASNPHLLMVGNFTEMIKQVSDGAVDFSDEDAMLTLPERIDRALEGSPLQPMWAEIYADLKEKGEVK